MKAFRLDELEAERAANDGAYLQFLRERNMSVGLYALDAGAQDPQQPHGQDEVYFVVSGRASITVGEETTQVARGSVVYVPAGVPHKFHHISEDLRVLVVFSPRRAEARPRGSLGDGSGEDKGSEAPAGTPAALASGAGHHRQDPAGSGRRGKDKAMREIFTGLPWWVKWIAVPVIALVVFGGLIASVVGFVIGLLFKALVFVALVGGLIYVVRKFTASSSSRDW